MLPGMQQPCHGPHGQLKNTNPAYPLNNGMVQTRALTTGVDCLLNGTVSSRCVEGQRLVQHVQWGDPLKGYFHLLTKAPFT